MILPPVLNSLHAQFLSDTNPGKDFSKETLVQMQARHKRIKDNYSIFFTSLATASLPTGGIKGEVLTKASDADLDVEWKPIVQTALSRNIDGGSAASVYLIYQK